jgi:cerevisin
MQLEPLAINETNPVMANPRPSGVYGIKTDDGIRSWGPARIIRRKNPFRRQSTQVEYNLTLNHEQQRTGAGVDIYILDSGINAAHQEFANRMTWAGGVTGGRSLTVGDKNFTQTITGNAFHGARVATCAGGLYNGIARDCEMFFVGISGSRLDYEADYLAKIEIAYDHYMARSDTNRPAVFNMSYGGKYDDATVPAAVTAAFEDMLDDGLIICISAGNDYYDLDDNYIIPAELHPEVIVVGGTDAYDLPMYTSLSSRRYATSYGSGVHIYAPARSVVTAAQNGQNDTYNMVSGTSFAAPYTAGVIACMLEGYQRLTSRAQVQAVTQKLFDNSTKGELRFGSAYFGDGVINDRLLYLDPHATFEEIEGLNPL